MKHRLILFCFAGGTCYLDHLQRCQYVFYNSLETYKSLPLLHVCLRNILHKTSCFTAVDNNCSPDAASSTRAVYPERNDSSIMTLSILMRWVVTQTNRMIPSMTRYAAATRSRRCPRESEPLACLKFESKRRVIFPLARI